MKAAEIKQTFGKNCLVKYGKSGQIRGHILEIKNDHLHVKEQFGEYSIPLEQITSVTPLTT